MDGSVAEHDESHTFKINLFKNTLSTRYRNARAEKDRNEGGCDRAES